MLLMGRNYRMAQYSFKNFLHSHCLAVNLFLFWHFIHFPSWPHILQPVTSGLVAWLFSSQLCELFRFGLVVLIIPLQTFLIIPCSKSFYGNKIGLAGRVRKGELFTHHFLILLFPFRFLLQPFIPVVSVVLRLFRIIFQYQDFITTQVFPPSSCRIFLIVLSIGDPVFAFPTAVEISSCGFDWMQQLYLLLWMKSTSAIHFPLSITCLYASDECLSSEESSQTCFNVSCSFFPFMSPAMVRVRDPNSLHNTLNPSSSCWVLSDAWK